MGGRRVASAVSSVAVAAMLQLALVASVPVAAFAQAGGNGIDASGRSATLMMLPRKADDTEAATVLQSLFRQSLEKLVGVQTRSLAPVRNPEKASQAAMEAQAGEEALNLDPALVPDFGTQALARFQRATELLRGAPGAGDERLRAWAEKGLGIAQVITGDRAEAAKSMRRSLLLVRDQTGAEYNYTPAAQEFFESVQRDMAAESAGSIEVVSEPAGAEVLVGGELRGYSPISVTNLSPGEHYVEVRRDGYFVWGAFVGVESASVAKQEVVLTEAPSFQALTLAKRKLEQKFTKANAEEVAQTIRTATAATDAIIARASLDKSGRFAVDGFHSTRSGELIPIAIQIERDASLITNIERFLAGLLDTAAAPTMAGGSISAPAVAAPTEFAPGDDTVIDPNSPLFKQTGQEEESITSKWWFWTLIGVGVAGVAAAIAVPLALSKEDGGSGPTGGLAIQLDGLGQ